MSKDGSHSWDTNGVIKKALTGRGTTTFLKKTVNRQMMTKEEEDFKHLRNEWSYKANQNLKQARRCEQYAFRLEVIAKGEGASIHEKLNREAIKGITKANEEDDEEWQRDLVLTLNRKNINQCKTPSSFLL